MDTPAGLLLPLVGRHTSSRHCKSHVHAYLYIGRVCGCKGSVWRCAFFSMDVKFASLTILALLKLTAPLSCLLRVGLARTMYAHPI